MFHRTVGILFLSLSLSAMLWAGPSQRYNVRGKLMDAETGAPIRYANVFLANTTRGTTSLADGSFTIERVPPGRYELVVSMMGYAGQRRQIKLIRHNLTLYTIRLAPKAIIGETITITAERNRKWKRQLSQFKTLFLGLSPHAKQCKIKNPELISFEETGNGGLAAHADGPLKIENRTLGYIITFYMHRFSVTAYGNLSYEGDSQFSEMQTEDAAQQRRWQRARKKAYCGSLKHFLKSLAAGTLADEGFVTYSLTGLPTPRATVSRTLLNTDSLSTPGDLAHEAILHLPRYLQVVYTQAAEPRFYTEIRRSMRHKFGEEFIKGPSEETIYPISYLEVHSPNLIVHLDGFIYTPQLLTTRGYWAWERMADMLPLDY